MLGFWLNYTSSQTYRQAFPKRAHKLIRAPTPIFDLSGLGSTEAEIAEAKADLEYDLFCALRDHDQFPAGGLMRRVRVSFRFPSSYSVHDSLF